MSEELSALTESFSDYLRRNREASGKSLDEIARTTKISKRYLEAFEAADLKNLPEEAFARGFLKNYASEIGLDVEDCLERFDQFRRSTMPTQVKDMKKVNTKPSLLLGGESNFPRAPAWLPLAFGGIIIVAGLVIGLWLWDNSSTDSDSVATEPAEIIVEEPEANGLEAGADTEFAAPIPPSILTLRAKETATVVLRVDEAAAQEVVIEKGSEKSFEVHRQIEIRDLNRNRLSLEYNGKPIEAAGPIVKLFNQNMFSK